MTAWLSQERFTAACDALPLVSIDLYVTRMRAGQHELLLGMRCNRPAQGWWFTPGGRIRKHESLPLALQRIAAEELGMAALTLPQVQLLGAYDHFYADSAYDATLSTHYVNLAYWFALDARAAEQLDPPGVADTQHSAWRWLPLSQFAGDAGVHENVKLPSRPLLAACAGALPFSLPSPVAA